MFHRPARLVHPLPNCLKAAALTAWLACSAAAAPAAPATPADDLHALLAEHTRLTDAADPIGAGQRGDLAAARRWPDDTPAAVQARAADWQRLAARLDALPAAGLSTEDALDRTLLRRRLAIELEGVRFDEERVPFNSDEGFFTVPAGVAEGTRLRTADQVDAYLARLHALPAYFAAETANLRRGIATGFTRPRRTAMAAARATRSLADRPAAEQPLLQPLDALPATLPAAQRAAWRAAALDIVEHEVVPAERALADFFATDYLPHAQDRLGADTLPDGRAYYAYLVRRETTTELTPDEVQARGRAEIARIRTAMDGVIAETGFHGSFTEFQASLRADPQFRAVSREDLLAKASRLAKRVDDRLPEFFGTLPRLSYGVREVPRDIEEGYTTGRYNPGSPEQGVSGGLMINTSHLDQRPLFELPALVAHEGAPGHHIQIAIAQELPAGTPQFRRDSDLTAFVEGWALYSERLAGDMGLYTTPYERFGQLSMEMWRACRLVVDVGIHAHGMSRDDAVACLRDNTALADVNIQNEVDRYIGWPGQALGYKIGELAIVDMRARAEKALGTRFDVRRFHDLILDEGAMPLDVLSTRVDDWIARGGPAAPTR